VCGRNVEYVCTFCAIIIPSTLKQCFICHTYLFKLLQVL
jgi:hypothetical protein